MTNHRFVDLHECIDAARRMKAKEFEGYLRKQREVPDLVSPTRAAELLGVRGPHIHRLEDQGRMPERVPIEGTHGAFIRSEVLSLAEELEAERAERRRRKEDKQHA